MADKENPYGKAKKSPKAVPGGVPRSKKQDSNTPKKKAA
jgi:hypothetical protein